MLAAAEESTKERRNAEKRAVGNKDAIHSGDDVDKNLVLTLVDATAGKHGDKTERPAEKNYYSGYTGKDAKQNDRRRVIAVRCWRWKSKCLVQRSWTVTSGVPGRFRHKRKSEEEREMDQQKRNEKDRDRAFDVIAERESDAREATIRSSWVTVAFGIKFGITSFNLLLRFDHSKSSRIKINLTFATNLWD